MAHILNHAGFIQAIRNLAADMGRDDVEDAIDADKRDRMAEPTYYGLVALEAAEKFFDSLDCATDLEPGCKPKGAIYMIYNKPGFSGYHCAPWLFIDGKPHRLLRNGTAQPYEQDWGYEFIAFQETSDSEDF